MSDEYIVSANPRREDGSWPCALRLRSAHPRDVQKIINHGSRTIGNTDHIDFTRTHMNKVLVGSDETGAELRKLYEEVKARNFESYLQGVKKKDGKKAYEKALKKGPQEPWKDLQKGRGPLREGVITIHRSGFYADDDCPIEHRMDFIDDEGNEVSFDKRRCQMFEDASLEFLKKSYGSLLKYVRADWDEQSIHLHFVLSDIIEHAPTSRYADGRRVFRTTHHPLVGNVVGEKIRGYERAQDAAGEFFENHPIYSELNITRGDKNAEAARNLNEKIEEDFKYEIAEQEIMEMINPEFAQPASADARKRIAVKEMLQEGKKVRQDDIDKAAILVLVESGALDKDKARETSSRRARRKLLEAFEESHGTPEFIVENFEEIVVEAATEARDEKMAEAETYAIEIFAEAEGQKAEALEIRQAAQNEANKLRADAEDDVKVINLESERRKREADEAVEVAKPIIAEKDEVLAQKEANATKEKKIKSRELKLRVDREILDENNGYYKKRRQKLKDDRAAFEEEKKVEWAKIRSAKDAVEAMRQETANLLGSLRNVARMVPEKFGSRISAVFAKNAKAIRDVVGTRTPEPAFVRGEPQQGRIINFSDSKPVYVKLGELTAEEKTELGVHFGRQSNQELYDDYFETIKARKHAKGADLQKLDRAAEFFMLERDARMLDHEWKPIKAKHWSQTIVQTDYSKKYTDRVKTRADDLREIQNQHARVLRR